ncbi:hypothetical protein BAE44_0002171, partial [Dichanthelium oligosanthes]
MGVGGGEQTKKALQITAIDGDGTLARAPMPPVEHWRPAPSLPAAAASGVAASSGGSAARRTTTSRWRGGHTAEMMNIVTTLQKDRFTPRYYVAALTDNMSLQKAQVLGLGWSSIFYIESIARVKKLSLSGLLLYKLRIADQFFVQWPQ